MLRDNPPMQGCLFNVRAFVESRGNTQSQWVIPVARELFYHIEADGTIDILAVPAGHNKESSPDNGVFHSLPGPFPNEKSASKTRERKLFAPRARKRDVREAVSSPSSGDRPFPEVRKRPRTQPEFRSDSRRNFASASSNMPHVKESFKPPPGTGKGEKYRCASEGCDQLTYSKFRKSGCTSFEPRCVMHGGSAYCAVPHCFEPSHSRKGVLNSETGELEHSCYKHRYSARGG